MYIRYFQIITVLLSFILSNISGIFTIIQSHTNTYNLLYSITSFILSIYLIIPLFYVHILLISFQFFLSILNIISGILLILNTNPKTQVIILFIIDIIFITSSFILILFIFFINSSTTSDIENHISIENDQISKKRSDATLFDKNYTIEQNWYQKTQQQQLGEKEEENRQTIQYSNSSNTIPLQKSQQHESFIMNLDDVHNIEEETNLSSKNIIPKSKSQSAINNNQQQLKKQRWKSFHDEKQFISNLNESLLPSLLKTNINQLQTEEIEETMKGLEPIGIGINGYPQKIQNNSSITLNEFNLDEYTKFRNFTDYNLIPGLYQSKNNTNDSNSNSPTYSMQQIHSKDIIDNIDELSELSLTQTNEIQAAPSLHTFRKESGNSKLSSQIDYDNFENDLDLKLYQSPPKTPPQLTQDKFIIQPKSNSPIKKFLNESPKRIFRSNTTNFSNHKIHNSQQQQQQQQNHKHSNSIISLKSGISSRSRSNSPKKLKKSILKIHKHSLSVPNFNQLSLILQDDNKNSASSSSVIPSPQDSTFNHSITSKNKFIEPIDLWEIHNISNFNYNEEIDIQTLNNNNNKIENINLDNDQAIKINEENSESRVSSLPSQVIGQYDKEKWKQIKDSI
ncbi:uncharacterized protein KGF55_005175 [Candida pseudojiufengensis]|uniref:uncharacterized protein n=1 Tax=Candida pseudojiufengensis TaxID=497109 RepID=UPI002224A3F3|nr:uncharacterized protein KGF55_005175 [Candida pseudojiufengensis]KAI5959943.1 hypothetical protein KGF55_005175 [Candida pseudojiufengensis]